MWVEGYHEKDEDKIIWQGFQWITKGLVSSAFLNCTHCVCYLCLLSPSLLPHNKIHLIEMGGFLWPHSVCMLSTSFTVLCCILLLSSSSSMIGSPLLTLVKWTKKREQKQQTGVFQSRRSIDLRRREKSIYFIKLFS